jgi:hypothetical protein
LLTMRSSRYNNNRGGMTVGCDGSGAKLSRDVF